VPSPATVSHNSGKRGPKWGGFQAARRHAPLDARAGSGALRRRGEAAVP